MLSLSMGSKLIVGIHPLIKSPIMFELKNICANSFAMNA
jgi:hypothetical protein